MGLRNIVIQGSLWKVFVHVFILTASQILWVKLWIFFLPGCFKKEKKKLNTSYSGELSHSKVFNCLSLFLYNLYVVQKSRDFYLFRNIFALFDNIKSLMGKLAICYLVAKYRKYLQMP